MFSTASRLWRQKPGAFESGGLETDGWVGPISKQGARLIKG